MKITLTEALNKLKVLDKKINKKIIAIHNGETIVVDYLKGNVNLTEKTKVSIAEFKKQVDSEIQALQQLIANRKVLKAKIAVTNSNTKVTIGGKEYTITEAIERKNSIDYEKRFVVALQTQYKQITDFVQKQNTLLQQKVDNLIDTRLSSDAKTKDNNEIIELSKQLYKKDELATVDVGILDISVNILEDMEQFLADVDTALSIVNATTYIEVDF